MIVSGLTYSYDGDLPTGTTYTGPIAGTISTGYDNFFRVNQIGVNGSTVLYAYDDDGLLTGAGSLFLTRHPTTGFVTGSTLGQIVTEQTHNAFGEVDSFTVKQGETILFKETYERNTVGQLSLKTVTASGQTNTYRYTYDDNGRLTDVTKDGTPIGHYEYDANGNRKQAYGLTAQYDAQDRLTSFGGTQYTYTNNGELKQAINGTDVTDYAYDVFGGLTHVDLPGGSKLDYLVDGLNRRIGKKVNGTLVQGFLYLDALKIAAELDGNNNVVSRFIYGGKANVPEYLVKNSVTYRIVTDQLGSVRLVINSTTGEVVQQIDYDEWGNVQADTNPGFQPFGYAGGIYDRHTKLTRFGARDYDAFTGRWTTKDPIRFAGGDTSLYAYVSGDPISKIDPSGLATQNDIDLAITLIREFAPELFPVGPTSVTSVQNLSSWYGKPLQGYTDLANNIQINAGLYGDNNTTVDEFMAEQFLETMAHELFHVQQSTFEKALTHGELHDLLRDNGANIAARLVKKFNLVRKKACWR